MRRLFNQVRNNYKNIDNFNYNIEESKTPRINNNNKFIPKIIAKNIEKNLNNSYLISFGNNKIIITTEKNHIDKKMCEKLINRIKIIKNICNNREPNKIYIWLSDYKKQYPNPNKGEIIGINNVNSGSCDIYPDKNGNIYIWRREELEKVLIHELLHSLRMDYEILNSKYLDNKIKNYFNLRTNININEAYTESLATIINCMIIAIKKKKDYQYFLGLLDKEIDYSKGQVNRLLEFNGFNNLGELEKTEGNKIFKQNSSVFSYYIMKAALINNFDEYSKFLQQQGGLKFNGKNREKYYKLLINSFNKLKREIGKKKYRGKSLRMTIN